MSKESNTNQGGKPADVTNPESQPPAATPVVVNTSVSDKLMEDAGITKGTENTVVVPAEKSNLEKTLESQAPELKPEVKNPEIQVPEAKTGGKPVVTNKTGESLEEPTINDDIVLKEIQKKFPHIKSLDDIAKIQAPVEKVLTPEEAEILREEKRNNALKFGLENKLFTKSSYDKFLQAQNGDKVKVVLENFISSLRETEPEINDSDAKERFDLKYGQLEDEESWLYKDGLKNIESEFDKIINKEYGKIVGMENVYEEVQKNIAQARIFGEKLDSVFKEKIKPEFQVKIDDEDIPVELFTNDELIKAKEDYLNEAMMVSIMDEEGNIDEAVLVEEVKKDLVYKNLQLIIARVAKSYGDKMVTGDRLARKGIKMESEIEIGGNGTPIDTSKTSYSDRLLIEANLSGN